MGRRNKHRRHGLMTAGAVGDALGVTAETARDWGKRGLLPMVRIGRVVRFPREGVEALARGAVDVVEKGERT